MDKQFLVAQMTDQLRASARVAQTAMAEAVIEAREGATPAERREDSRVAQEQSGLARGHHARAERIEAELDELMAFRPAHFAATARIGLGAIVEVEDGNEGRTFFLAPVGAGMELTGPGGDGFLSVVTPHSPLGRAVTGRRVGDTIEIDSRGDTREWTVAFVG